MFIKRRNKYGSTKCRDDMVNINGTWHPVPFSHPKMKGIIFDSKLEMTRARQLCFLEDQGEIYDLNCEPAQITISDAHIRYTPDFVYSQTGCSSGVYVMEEVKGYETERWTIIKQLWKVYGPCKLIVTKNYGSHGNVVIRVSQEIVPDNISCK